MGMIVLGRRRPRRHGRGFMDFLKKANTFVKDNKLISKGLALAESTGLADKLRESTLGNLALQGASMAADHGYGRRRRRRVGAGRKRRGGARKTITIVIKPKAGGRRRRVGRPRKYY